MSITDKYAIREMNEKLVLRTVIQEGSISRADLAKVLNLNKTSVSSIVADLIDKNLVLETGAGESSGGRKPILVMFNQEAGYSLAFDVGPNYISSLLTYLDGSFVADSYDSIDDPSIENIYHILEASISNYLKQIKTTPYGITGICIGLHGIVYQQQLVFSPFHDLDCQELIDKIQAQFELPVIIENEANLAALGEQNLEPQVENLVSLSVKYGIGAGVISDGTLYTGCDGHAGEVGHLITNINGRPCACGNRGCLEQYASEYNILKRYKADDKIEKGKFMRFKQDYLKGDPVAGDVMDQFIQYMMVAVNNLIVTFNPEVIIINSRITNQIEGIVRGIQDQLVYKGRGDIIIKPSTLDRKATLVGGVHLNKVTFLGI